MITAPSSWSVCGQGVWHRPPYYSPDSIFDRPLTAPLAANQTPAQRIANQMQYGRQGRTFFGYPGIGYGYYQWPYSLGFNVNQFTFPVYAVSPSDPAQNITIAKVALYLPNGGSPYLLGAQYDDLQQYLLEVPLPDKTLCPKITGTTPYEDIWSHGEKAFAVINLDTGEYYEFFEFTWSGPASLQAAAGTPVMCQMAAYVPNVNAFNGAFHSMWGARGTSLGAIGGLITMQDLRDVNAGGDINHALCFALPMNGGINSQVLPATRGDGPGSNNVATIPAGYPNAGQANPAYGKDTSSEGTLVSLPAGADSAATTPLGAAIARAHIRYGAYAVDTSSAVPYYVEDPRTLGSPYHLQGPDAVDPWTLTWPGGSMLNLPARGSGYTVLHDLPWDELRAHQPAAV